MSGSKRVLHSIRKNKSEKKENYVNTSSACPCAAQMGNTFTLKCNVQILRDVPNAHVLKATKTDALNSTEMYANLCTTLPGKTNNLQNVVFFSEKCRY